jgi:hypothetical protein
MINISDLSGDRRQKRSMDEPYDYDYDFCWDDFVDYDNDDELRPNFRKLDFDLSDFEVKSVGLCCFQL